jgi:L-aminopeptidase/D-esterase-like protein
MKGGVGSASEREEDLIVGALAAVNAWGEVIDEEGEALAGSRVPAPQPESTEGPPGISTTLAVVATNARLSKERAHLLAVAAHEGIGAAVRPSHTRWDGDTVFTLATGAIEADQRTIERLAESVVAEAIRRAVRLARSVPGVPSVSDIETS